MNPWQRMVKDFQSVIGKHSIETRPPDEDTRKLRARLLEEECKETIEALEANDWEGVIDGLCDVIYIALGTAESYGVDLEPFFEEVHRANMAKFPGGVVTINEHGKVQKPADWKGPDHRRVLARDPVSQAHRNEALAYLAWTAAREDRRRCEEIRSREILAATRVSEGPVTKI